MSSHPKLQPVQWLRGSVIALLLLLTLLSGALSVQAAEPCKVYSFGIVPQFEARRIFDIWWPILLELEKKTGLEFELIGSPSIPAFEARLEQGYFDFAYMNPYHMLRQLDAGSYTPMIRDGEQQVKGILVVQKDSPIQHVTELVGAKVAFPAPNALGASLLTRAELARNHFVTVQPQYVGTHSSVYLNVVTGVATAGGGVMKTLKEQEQSIQDSLRILYTTRGTAAHPISAHSRITEDVRKKVTAALLSMAGVAEERSLLSKIPLATPVTASEDDYLVLRDWQLDEFFEK